jgi:two-component system, NtrC family, sensor kinase
VGRVVLERQVVQIRDVLADPEYTWAHGQKLGDRPVAGVRTALGVPMLREEDLIGVLLLWNEEVRSFTDKQVDLVKTFADQAVIAIENVRLFTELQEKNRALTKAHAQVTEALEQQTATAEILRVISSSPTEVQPVFDLIVHSAVTLCNGFFSAVFRFDGEQLHLVAHYNFSPEALEIVGRAYPLPLSRANVAARAVMERMVVHVPDIQSDREATTTREFARVLGFRAILAVPMLREGVPMGCITVSRVDAAFSQKQIDLLETFADQAVIATSRGSSPTCPTSSGRPSTPSLASRRSSRSGCSGR